MTTRKYGRPNVIKLDPLAYNITLVGESGLGKSTVIKEACEKLVGQEGYMFLDIGKEEGTSAINGAVAEPVWDWEKFDDVTTDIIDNRFTAYKDLRVVVIDTFDELMSMAEQRVVTLWNRENPDKATTSFKATYGGFNGPTDKAIQIVFDRLWELKRAGVAFICIGHTRKKEVSDPVSGQSYSILTTNMDSRYFSALKNKTHFLGVCYIDRNIIQKKTGKKNVVTGKEEVIGVVNSEKRVICFRDDNFSVDSKSRFADIVDHIPLDSDALITAINDAIRKEHDKSGVPYEKSAALQKEQKQKEENEIRRQQADKKSAAEAESQRAILVEKIAAEFPNASEQTKAKAKALLAESGAAKFTSAELSFKTLQQIADLF